MSPVKLPGVAQPPTLGHQHRNATAELQYRLRPVCWRASTVWFSKSGSCRTTSPAAIERAVEPPRVAVAFGGARCCTLPRPQGLDTSDNFANRTWEWA